MSAAATIANHLHLTAAAPSYVRFRHALRDPGVAQRRLLRSILQRNAHTAFGRTHRFSGIADATAYRARVPARDYDGFAPWIDRVLDGRAGVLTDGPVRFVEPSGGSSGASKLVPYTSALLDEFSSATMPWIFDLLHGRRRLRGGCAYWAITPPGRRPSCTAGGVPIGMEHDRDYFPPLVRAMLDRTLAVPTALVRSPDVATCRYLTLRALLARPDLVLISVWSPSFLTLLAEGLDEHFPALLHDLATGDSRRLPDALRRELASALPAHPARAAALRRRFGRRPPEDLGLIWERLALVSCWTDGHARRALDGMRRRFPHVEVQGKGLLATEGVVSVPLFEAEGAVAAVTSHFLEFLPIDGRAVDEERALIVDELEQGRSYEVLLTTSGGLYRYRLRDVVHVDRFFERTPVLSFRGRSDHGCDLAGEKLTPALVERVLGEASALTGVRPAFAMLAPACGEPPSYALYVDATEDAAALLAGAVEGRLRTGHHYALCRELGQLGPVRGVSVPDAERRYERVRTRRGQRAGAVKPPVLEPELGWERHFAHAITES
jgi:hypothetical protein